MIPRAYITEWRENASWKSNEQVEQDLIIYRALVEIYSDPLLKKRLAFRGGTALHKIYLRPPSRYSEDIDLVQVSPGPIGDILDLIREKLRFLGKPRVKQKNRNNTLTFSFDSEIPPVIGLKLKIEVNCREHFTVFGLADTDLKVASRWFSGNCRITTYGLEELLGSKLRALYQRKKGRDLFDLWYALHIKKLYPERIIKAFYAFMQDAGCSVTRKQFFLNMEQKVKDSEFRNDISGLLRPDIKYNIDWAYQSVQETLINRLK